MKKLLHVLVYVFLVLAGAALYFELQLNDKRTELTARNRMQEDYLVRIARTIEKSEPDKNAVFEIKKDNSPVEARIVDSPDMEDTLEDYQAPLEQANLETYNWESSREQLRQVFVLDGEGKPMMDGNEPMTRGSPEEKLLSALLESAKNQQAKLNSTRAALTELRGKLESSVGEINKLKPDGRQDKVTIEEQKEKIAKLEEEKADLENQITKIKAQIDELNGEITSLKDEVTTAKNETEDYKEKLAQSQKLVEKLKDMIAKMIPTQSAKGSGGVAISSIPAGDKGKVVKVDAECGFAIVEFTDEAMKQLKGEDLNNPLPPIELGLKRAGFQGEAGEFVGRIRLRQEVQGKNYVICEILEAWSYSKAAEGDVVFAD